MQSPDRGTAVEFQIVVTPNLPESILLIGASGRTGLCVLRYLCAAAVPVIACVRRPDRLPAEPRLAAAEVAVVNLQQPGAIAPLFERAAQVIYLAGSARNSLSPGAWQLEVESLTTCLEFAQRSGFHGRWSYVGCSDDEPAAGATWAETRWRELKQEAEQALKDSSVDYFILRTGRVTGVILEEPRVRVSQEATASSSAAPLAGELPCNVLAFLLTGIALAGAAHRAEATVRLDPSGVNLQEAVHAFGRLRSERVERSSGSLHLLRGGAFHRK